MIFSQNNTPEIAEKALTSVALNPHGYHVAMEFLIQHWDKFNTNATEKHNN